MLEVVIISYMVIQKVNMDLIRDFTILYLNFHTQKIKQLKTKNSLFLIKLLLTECQLVLSPVMSALLGALNLISKI
jgi:hypothetical protein